MKKLTLLAFALMFFSNSVFSQLAAWNFNGESSPTTSAADVVTPNVIISSMTRGAGATASTASNSFRTQGFQNNGIATTNTDYFQVTIQAAANYSVSLSSLDAKLAGTTSFANSPGVSNQFAYSLDGTTFTLIGSPTVTLGTPATIAGLSLSGISALQNVPNGTTITLRFYASGQTNTGGWGFNSPSTAAADNGLTITGTAVLPIHLSSFTANKNILNFRTEGESNNSHFLIERSANGQDFVEITRIKGAGTTNVPQNYNYTDVTAPKGVNYYRLKQVDFDGRFEYSKTVQGNFGEKSLAINLVNINASNLNLNIFSDKNSEIKLEILDMQGRIVKSFQNEVFQNENEISLDVSLENGIYILKASTTEGEFVSKVISIK